MLTVILLLMAMTCLWAAPRVEAAEPPFTYLHPRVEFGEGWQASVVLVNLNQEATNVRLLAYDDGGSLLAQISGGPPLRPGDRRTFSQAGGGGKAMLEKTSASEQTPAEETSVAEPRPVQVTPRQEAPPLSPEERQRLEDALEQTHLPGPRLPKEPALPQTSIEPTVPQTIPHPLPQGGEEQGKSSWERER